MSRHHRRHHRKIKSPAVRAVVNESIAETPAENAQLRLENNGALAAVRHDLWRTVAITGLLILALIILSYINHRQGWTVQFGSTLYRLLHIR
jgi:hypothetical protein